MNMNVFLKFLVFMSLISFFQSCGSSDSNNNTDTDNEPKSSFFVNEKTPYVARINGKDYTSSYNTINDQFFIGSISKVYTATMIFNLQDKNLLNINDTIDKYIPSTGSETDLLKDITIKDLLSHRSGIRDGSDEDTLLLAFTEQSKEHIPNTFLTHAIYTKDTNFSYANANYILLGVIIEKITNKSYEDNLNEIIIDKLKLTNTCITVDKIKCNPQRGFVPVFFLGINDKSTYPNGYTQIDDYKAFTSIAGSAGNIVTNLAELELFFKALVQNTFFDFSLMKEFTDIGFYGLGIMKSGNMLFGHEGQTLDTSSKVVINTETLEATIIIVGDANTNLSKFEENIISEIKN